MRLTLIRQWGWGAGTWLLCLPPPLLHTAFPQGSVLHSLFTFPGGSPAPISLLSFDFSTWCLPGNSDSLTMSCLSTHPLSGWLPDVQTGSLVPWNLQLDRLKMLALVAQSRLTLGNPMDYNVPGSSVHGHSPDWSELPCPPPWDLLNPGVKPWSPALQADSLPSEPPGKPKDHLTSLLS